MTKEEEMLLRQLAAGQCTIQKVGHALGPLSLWSDKALKAEIHEAVEAEREACALLCEELKYDGYEMVKDNPVLARKIRARGNT
jgi:hypothetical protein